MLRQVIERLKTSSNPERVLRETVIDTGGIWIEPAGASPGSHLYEISLCHVTGRGRSVAEAVDDWRLAAQATVQR